jgi:GDPmannose 4,6-dehydratase
LEEFVDHVFGAFGLPWRQHVELDQALLRPFESIGGYGNAAKARRELEWSAGVRFKEVVRRLVYAERDKCGKP